MRRVWETHATLITAADFISGGWALVFLDDADVQGALGYHDLTPDGLPLSKVFVKTTIANKHKVSVTACHELAEMLVDPATNLWAEAPDGTLYAYEMCDAVEETEITIDGIAMSDFVYPSYFEGFRKAKSTQFDYARKISKPFQLLSGGYSIVQKGGAVSNIYGSAAKKARFLREDRRGHRSEYRCAGVTPRVRSRRGR